MARINLGNGRWFDTSAAEVFKEDTRWNGQNHISCATGSQWDHEELYRTRRGVWILHCWSQWQGTVPEYREIPPETARTWLIDQGEMEAVQEHFPGALEAGEV